MIQSFARSEKLLVSPPNALPPLETVVRASFSSTGYHSSGKKKMTRTEEKQHMKELTSRFARKIESLIIHDCTQFTRNIDTKPNPQQRSSLIHSLDYSLRFEPTTTTLILFPVTTAPSSVSPLSPHSSSNSKAASSEQPAEQPSPQSPQPFATKLAERHREPLLASALGNKAFGSNHPIA